MSYHDATGVQQTTTYWIRLENRGYFSGFDDEYPVTSYNINDIRDFPNYKNAVEFCAKNNAVLGDCVIWRVSFRPQTEEKA